MTFYPPVSPFAAGFACKCPRCGQGALFEGFLSLRASCAACGLDYAKADPGDGPAVFVMFIVGALGVVTAFFARFVLHASMLTSFALSAAISVGLILILLRPFKATLIALQFVHKAEEGQPINAADD